MYLLSFRIHATTTLAHVHSGTLAGSIHSAALPRAIFHPSSRACSCLGPLCWLTQHDDHGECRRVYKAWSRTSFLEEPVSNPEAFRMEAVARQSVFISFKADQSSLRTCSSAFFFASFFGEPLVSCFRQQFTCDIL